MQAVSFSAPLLVGGGAKVAYDLLLYKSFRGCVVDSLAIPRPRRGCGHRPSSKATDPRVRLFVLGYCPTPVSDALCGLPPPLSATRTIALRVPVAVGLNRKLTVQLPPPASEVPQVFPETR